VQDKPPNRRSYSGAETAAGLAAFHARKRRACSQSLAAVAVACAVSVRWLPVPALALLAGGICGSLNVFWTARAGDRLLENRRVGGFVLSSFGRIALFGIVPVAFAAFGPWWSMAWYFAGFFLPLGIFAYGLRRAE
jgi:hypothetical protein